MNHLYDIEPSFVVDLISDLLLYVDESDYFFDVGVVLLLKSILVGAWIEMVKKQNRSEYSLEMGLLAK